MSAHRPSSISTNNHQNQHNITPPSSTPHHNNQQLQSPRPMNPYSPQHLLQLQRQRGNAYVQRMIAQQNSRISTRANMIQRWDSPEHVALGDQSSGGPSSYITIKSHQRELPQREEDPETWTPQWRELYQSGNAQQKRFLKSGLTYGEMVALSGDFYEDYDALNNASLREVYDLIPLIRDGGSTSELQSATGGRYLALAKENERHFSNVSAGHSNLETWRAMHRQAIMIARQGDENTAWGMNASADHFLTDAFSGGHIRTPRSDLMEQGSMGDIESAILHNLDNENGVNVTNGRGDGPWIAYGDDMLEDPRNDQNRTLSIEAVQLSKNDIKDALSQGEDYPEPDESTQFEAERLVPHAVDPSEDRWSGRVPTFSMGPDGSMHQDFDQFTQMRNELIINEGPGMVASLFNDDNQIRDWVGNQDLSSMGRQPVAEKIRMINVLMNGWISDDDVEAIERICESTSDSELSEINDAISPRLIEMQGLGQRMRVRIAIEGISANRNK